MRGTVLIIIVFLILGTYLWSKLHPELIYGIMNGYDPRELKQISTHSFTDIIQNRSFEAGIAYAGINFARGYIFTAFLKHSLLVPPWQQWLALCLLLTSSTSSNPTRQVFWKRWTLFLGGGTLLCPELVQLSLALFLAFLILTQSKRYLVWSIPIAALLIIYSEPEILPLSEFIMMFIVSLATSFGFKFPNLHLMVNNAKQKILLTKGASRSI